MAHEGSRKLRFPDFMTTAQDGGKVVSLTHRPPLPPGNTPGSHFCWRLSRLQGHSATGRIMSLKNSNDAIGNRTRDLPVCSSKCFDDICKLSYLHTLSFFLSELSSNVFCFDLATHACPLLGNTVNKRIWPSITQS